MTKNYHNNKISYKNDNDYSKNDNNDDNDRKYK